MEICYGAATLVTKLFISHAANDKPIVESFVELVESGIGVSPHDIFCTSLKGQGIKPGQDFVESIGRTLGDAVTVVALLSKHFYNSQFCMCELGAVWIKAKDFIPILVPPLGFDALRAVLEGKQALKLQRPEDLDELRDELVSRLGISKPLSTPRWSGRRDRFLEMLPAQLKAIPKTLTVARAEMERAEKMLREYKTEYDAAQAEIVQLKEQIEDLSKLKDRAAVAEVVRKHSSEEDLFQTMVNEVKAALRPLPRVVREALYYGQRGEPYSPSRNDWDDVQEEIENGLLIQYEDERGVAANGRNGKVERARRALGTLDKWLQPATTRSGHARQDDGHASKQFRAAYHEAHEEEADLHLRPFWTRHFR